TGLDFVAGSAAAPPTRLFTSHESPVTESSHGPKSSHHRRPHGPRPKPPRRGHWPFRPARRGSPSQPQETRPAGRRHRQAFRQATGGNARRRKARQVFAGNCRDLRSEEHTSELQSLRHLVCRLLLEKKKINKCDMKRED